MITLSTSDVVILICGIYLSAIMALALAKVIATRLRKILSNRASETVPERIEQPPVVAQSQAVLTASVGNGPSEKMEFDTTKARPLMPAVAAERFAHWMRQEGYTDYLWVGEIDECYQWFCRENNYFPVEAKALRELLYRVPGVYWGRPRLGGANWERFRRQMTDWHADRGQRPPERPVVIRILPHEMVPTARVRDWPGEEQYESGHGAARSRTAAPRIKKLNQNKSDGRVQERPNVDFEPREQWRAARAA